MSPHTCYLGDGTARSRCGLVRPLVCLQQDPLVAHWCPTCASTISESYLVARALGVEGSAGGGRG